MTKKDLLPVLQRQYEVGANANHQIFSRGGFVLTGLIAISTIWWRLCQSGIVAVNPKCGSTWTEIGFALMGLLSVASIAISFVWLAIALYPRDWKYADQNLAETIDSLCRTVDDVPSTVQHQIISEFAFASKANRVTNDRRYGFLQAAIKWLFVACVFLAAQAGCCLVVLAQSQ